MAASKSWSELVRLTSGYPSAMSPPELYGYLVARLIDMKGLESTPWLEDVLGVQKAYQVPESVGEVASRFLKDLLRSFGEIETAGKLPDFEADSDRHWARDWARGTAPSLR